MCVDSIDSVDSVLERFTFAACDLYCAMFTYLPRPSAAPLRKYKAELHKKSSQNEVNLILSEDIHKQDPHYLR